MGGEGALKETSLRGVIAFGIAMGAPSAVDLPLFHPTHNHSTHGAEIASPPQHTSSLLSSLVSHPRAPPDHPYRHPSLPPQVSSTLYRDRTT